MGGNLYGWYSSLSAADTIAFIAVIVAFVGGIIVPYHLAAKNKVSDNSENDPSKNTRTGINKIAIEHTNVQGNISINQGCTVYQLNQEQFSALLKQSLHAEQEKAKSVKPGSKELLWAQEKIRKLALQLRDVDAAYKQEKTERENLLEAVEIVKKKFPLLGRLLSEAQEDIAFGRNVDVDQLLSALAVSDDKNLNAYMADAAYQLGIMFEKSGEMRIAYAFFKQATMLAPLNYHYLLKATWLGLFNANYDDSEFFARHAYKIANKNHGRDHTSVAECLQLLGDIYFERGQYRHARRFLLRAEKIFQDSSKVENQEFSSLLNSLAIVHQHEGKLEDAERFIKRAIEIIEKVLSPDMENKANCFNTFGEVLREKGDHDGALDNLKRALVMREKIFGPEHPDVANSLNNIGAVLHAKGDYDGALKNHNRSLVMSEKIFGPEHPDVATSLNNIGAVLRAKGDYYGARNNFERAYVIAKKAFGEAHSNTLTFKSHLDSLLRLQ